MNACRICLSRYGLSPLFGELRNCRFNAQQLLSATGVKIEPNDGLPQSACQSCIRKINRILDFRKFTTKVDQILREIITKYASIVKEEVDIFDINNVFLNNITSNKVTTLQDGNISSDDDFIATDIKAYANNSIDSLYDKSTSKLKIKPKLERIIKHDSEDALDNNVDVADNDNDDDNDYDSDSKNDITGYHEVLIEDKKPVIYIDEKPNNLNLIDENSFDNAYAENKLKHRSKTNKLRQKVKSSAKVTNHRLKQKIKKEELAMKKRRYCNMQSENVDVSEKDIERGKVSNIRIEDVMSKTELDELLDQEREEQVLDPNTGEMKTVKRKPIQFDGFVYSNYYKKLMSGTKFTRKDNSKHLMSLAIKPKQDNGTLECRVCHKVVKCHCFKSHATIHFEAKYVCECGKKFFTAAVLGYHQQRRHGKEKRLACPHCDFRAVDTLAIKNHVRAAHTGERPYVCDVCGASFRMRGNIVQHMKSHFAVKNIQCELCPSLFDRRSTLWIHQMKRHFVNYSYRCYLCPQTYKGTKPVRNHLRNVHGIPVEQQLKIPCIKTRKDGSPITKYGIPTTETPTLQT